MLRQFFSSNSKTDVTVASTMSNQQYHSSGSSSQMPIKMDVTMTDATANISISLASTSSSGDSKMQTNASSSSKPGGPDVIDPTNNDSLVSLFECPVCFEYVLPPILQCQNGHLICKTCRGQITACPSCRAVFGPTNIRNLSLEKLSSTVRFPCKYSNNGCTEIFYHKDKTEHEELRCLFKPYTCPCPGSSCKWSGAMDAVMHHLMTAHKSITTLEGEDIVFLATDINLSGAVDWVMIQSCFGHHFMLVLEKAEKYRDHQQFFAAVVLIGGEKAAKSFLYRLELSGQKRRLIWEAQPRSINEGVQAAISNSDCLVFDASIAQHFSDGGNLGINVTIQQVPVPKLKAVGSGAANAAAGGKSGSSQDGKSDSLSAFGNSHHFSEGGGSGGGGGGNCGASGSGGGPREPNQRFQVDEVTGEKYMIVTRSIFEK